MKKSAIVISLLFAWIAGFAQQQRSVTIEGKVSGDTRGYDYVYYYSGSTPMDSVLISNGRFVVRKPFTEIHSLVFMTQYGKVMRRSYETLVLLIDGSGDIQVEMDITKGFSDIKLSGSSAAVDYYNFRKQQGLVNKRVDEGVNSLYGKTYVPKGDPLYDMFFNARDSLYKLFMGELVSEFVGMHKNEFLGPYVLISLGRSVLGVEKLDAALKSLSLDMRKTPEAEKIAAYLRGVKNSYIGATVKNFVLNNQEGKPISFDQFKGKYVWIDFWASWCAPCKKAFPHMKEIYAQYREKGLEILGVSTDSKIEPWLNILPNLQNPWPQVWDNKNIMSEFAVTAFPTSFLIDPNGVILLKEIGYDPNGESPLDKKLEFIFGDKVGSVKTP